MKLVFKIGLDVADLLLDDCECSSEDDGAFYGKGENPTKVPIVFAEEYQHGFVEHMGVAIGIFMSAFTFIVQNIAWNIIVCEA